MIENNQLTMRRTLLQILFLSLFALPLEAQVKLGSATFGQIEARSIGPAVMGGRITAIEGVNKSPKILYVGTAGGGVWKSTTAGFTFEPVFEKYPQSVGALAIDQAHPDTVWVGTGESNMRNSVSVGLGIYRSTDGGRNWTKWASTAANIFPESSFTRPIPIPFTWQCRAASGATAPTGGCTKPPTAAKPGKKSSTPTKKRVAPTSSWTRATRTCCWHPCGSSGAHRILSRRAARAAHCTKAPTAAKPGVRSRTACLRANSGASRSHSRRARRTTCSLSWKATRPVC